MSQESKESVFSKNKKKIRKSLQKRMKRVQEAIIRQEQALQNAKEYARFTHFGNLLKANFTKLVPRMTEITVEDFQNDNKKITIPLNPKQSPKELLEYFFKKAKKLARAETPLRSALEKQKKQYQQYRDHLNELETIQDSKALSNFQEKLKIGPRHVAQTLKRKAKELPYHVFQSASKLSILVGKNGKGNDELTFRVAKGDDLWLHIKDASGSHVIIQKKKNHAIDQKTIEEASQLAIYFSKLRAVPGKQEVIVTERREVKRLKNAPSGKVNVSSYKVVVAHLQKELVEEIKQRTLYSASSLKR